MIKCSNGECTHGEGLMCCNQCCDMDCTDRCDDNCETCGNSTNEDVSEVTLFQNKAMVVMNAIVDLDRKKKTLEAQDKEFRRQLEEFMNMYGIKKFENDFLKITHIEPSTRFSIDSTKLKKELPAIAEKYTKTNQVKGFVKIEVK